MNYNINVNQLAIVENGLDIDLIDAAIFDFYQKLYPSPSAKRMKSDSKYIEIKWDFVIKRLPILGIKTRQGVFNRMDKLCEAGLLERHPDSQKLNGSYFCPGEKYDLMFAKMDEPVNETLQGCKPNFTAPVNETLHAYKVDALKDNALKKNEEAFSKNSEIEKLPIEEKETKTEIKDPPPKNSYVRAELKIPFESNSEFVKLFEVLLIQPKHKNKTNASLQTDLNKLSKMDFNNGEYAVRILERSMSTQGIVFPADHEAYEKWKSTKEPIKSSKPKDFDYAAYYARKAE